MSTKGSGSEKAAASFGPWLLSHVKARGMTQGEFAKAISVSPTSVSRWIHGDKPKGEHIDKIADVLVLDYDLVATRAGYRPAPLDVDLESNYAQVLGMVNAIDWETDPGRLDHVKAILTLYINYDEREAEKDEVLERKTAEGKHTTERTSKT